MSHFLRFSLALALVLALPIAGQAATKKKKAATAPAESAAAAKPADHDYTGAIVIDAAVSGQKRLEIRHYRSSLA